MGVSLNLMKVMQVKTVETIPREAKMAGSMVQGEFHCIYSTGSLLQVSLNSSGTKPEGQETQLV